MASSFSNFSSTLSDVLALSGSVGLLSINFSDSNSRLNTLSGTVGNNTTNLFTLSGTVVTNTVNLSNLSGTVSSTVVDLNTVSGVANSNTVNLSNLTNDVTTLSGTVVNNTNSVTTLSGTLSPSSYGAVLRSDSGTTTWSYERVVRYDVTVPSGSTSYHFNSLPLSEVTFNLDYDNTYYFDTTQLSGVQFALSYNPNTLEALPSGYVSVQSNYTTLRVPRTHCVPVWVLDSNDTNFGGVQFDKPYLNYGVYATVSGTRNVRNRDALLCYGDTTLYLPTGTEGYKFTFNVLSGTTSYYCSGSDTFFDSSTSGTLSTGGAVAFYTNNKWFLS